MKNTKKCPKCDSEEIIANATAIDRGESFAQTELSVATFQNPEALIFKGQFTSPLSAYVCVGCGYVEFYADSTSQLKMGKT
jgi:predicted nucleic-acid-binding Zn-ribbon protein